MVEPRAFFFFGGELEPRIDAVPDTVAVVNAVADAVVIAFSSHSGGGREWIEADKERSEMKLPRANPNSEVTNTIVR